MAKILLVDPSGTDRQSIAQLLRHDPDIHLQCVSSQAEALETLAQWAPDLVITDVEKAAPDTLQLLEAIHRNWPSIPVLVLTSETAGPPTAEALRRGAAAYLSKSLLGYQLRRTVSKLLTAAGREPAQTQLVGCITETSCVFLLENDLSLIGPLISYLQENLAQLGLLDPMERTRIGLALQEALSNAIIHGNLELSSQLKDIDDQAFDRLLAERRQKPPYCFRKVSLEVTITPQEARFVITDEGPGFNPQEIPNPLEPANLERCSGRGILLMRTFMDEVCYNQKGNQVTLIKRFPFRKPPASAGPLGECPEC